MASRLAARSIGKVPSGAASTSNRAAPDARSQKTKAPGCSECTFAGRGLSTGLVRVLFRKTSPCPNPTLRIVDIVWIYGLGLLPTEGGARAIRMYWSALRMPYDARIPRKVFRASRVPFTKVFPLLKNQQFVGGLETYPYSTKGNSFHAECRICRFIG